MNVIVFTKIFLKVEKINFYALNILGTLGYKKVTKKIIYIYILAVTEFDFKNLVYI